MNYQQLCLGFLPTIEQTGQYIQDQFNQREAINFQLKSKNNVVSEVDRHAEEILVEKAKQLLPQATFLTEEQTVSSKPGEYQWIIDPLDGTTNFYYGIPIFAISVALVHHNKIVLGIVQDVMHNDTFYAWQGGGCYLNGVKTLCTPIETTNEVFIATGIPNYDFDYVSEYLSSLNEIINSTRGIRRLGSAALELAYVAAGRFNAFFESGLKPWDIAASICLINESGGVVTDLLGGQNYLYGKSILAASQQVHPQLLEHLKSLSNTSAS